MLKLNNHSFDGRLVRASTRLTDRSPRPRTVGTLLRHGDWHALRLTLFAMFCWLMGWVRGRG